MEDANIMSSVHCEQIVKRVICNNIIVGIYDDVSVFLVYEATIARIFLKMISLHLL